MAEIKISQLDAAASLTGSELVEIVQSGENKKTTTQAVANLAGSSYLVAEVTLTDDQIKALPTTPVEIVAAPGAGKYLQLIIASVYANFVSAYNIDLGAYILNDNGNGFGSELFTIATAEPLQNIFQVQMDGSSSAPNVIENKNLAVISFDGVNLTGGNAANTLKVTVYYVIVDL